MVTELRIATRGSSLAMAQTARVVELLEAAHPDLTVTVVPVESSGDADHKTPVARLTETGAFVRSLQRAILDGRAEAAVHSCKDLPTSGPGDLIVTAYPERETPLDVLVGVDLDRLPRQARVGTGSPRRAAQLRELRADLSPVELRGNVDTRLDRVGAGDPPAAVLAEAGLRRLGRQDAVTRRFSPQEMVPAPGQGALAVEARAGGEAAGLLAAIDDLGVRGVVEAERRLLARTGAGCRSALGALAEWTPAGQLRMAAFVEDERGPRAVVVEEGDPDMAVERVCRELGL